MGVDYLHGREWKVRFQRSSTEYYTERLRGQKALLLAEDHALSQSQSSIIEQD